jgi:hypothetical protein
MPQETLPMLRIRWVSRTIEILEELTSWKEKKYATKRTVLQYNGLTYATKLQTNEQKFSWLCTFKDWNSRFIGELCGYRGLQWWEF